jgi:hypothetical protein
MDKSIRNYEEEEVKPMTTREFFRYLKENRRQKKAHKNHNHHEVQVNEGAQVDDGHVCGPECQPQPIGNLPPQNIDIYSVAIVINDVVADVMNVQAAFGELLLKGPKFIKIEEGTPRPQVGFFYVDGEFKSLQDTVGRGVTTRNF